MYGNLKRQIVDGYEVIYSSDWIESLEPLRHWIYYWNQASLVWDYVDKDSPLIEIGIGTGFLKNYLNNQGWKCTTIDIDEAKQPDVIADISSAGLSNLNFECVLAFEIFEHIPYPLFKRALHNISQNNPKYIIFSLPWSQRRIFELNIKLPKIKEKTFSLYMRKHKISTKTHFWELKKGGKCIESVFEKGHKGLVPISKIKDSFSLVGYNLKIKQKVGNIQFFVAESNNR